MLVNSWKPEDIRMPTRNTKSGEGLNPKREKSAAEAIDRNVERPPETAENFEHVIRRITIQREAQRAQRKS